MSSDARIAAQTIIIQRARLISSAIAKGASKFIRGTFHGDLTGQLVEWFRTAWADDIVQRNMSGYCVLPRGIPTRPQQLPKS